MGVSYATVEEVRLALDSKEAALNQAQIERAIESASRVVDGLCARHAHGFAPVIATRYFPRPDPERSRAWRLWLDENELISITSLVSGGITLDTSEYFLEPVNSGPPFRSVEINLATGAAFQVAASSQRALAITGLWGFSDDQDPAGALAGSIDDSVTTVDVTNSNVIGIGQLIKVDDERMIVRDKAPFDTGDTVQIAMTDRKSDNSLAVTDGSDYYPGEVLVVGTERLRVVLVTANTLTVVRADGGSTLAAHDVGDGIYALRSLVVSRGVLGTSVASHSDAAEVTKWRVPEGIRDLTIAEAIVQNEQEATTYGMRMGTDMAERDSSGSENLSGRGLVDKRRSVRREYGRKARKYAV